MAFETINVRRLRRVAKYIVEHYSSFDMGKWHGAKARGQERGLPFHCTTVGAIALSSVEYASKKGASDTNSLQKELTKIRKSNRFLCDTEHCFAGWANLLYVKLINPHSDTKNNAMALFGLNWDQARRLFHTDHWPTAFRQQYDKARTKKKKALILQQRVENFIKHDGWEPVGEFI